MRQDALDFDFVPTAEAARMLGICENRHPLI